MFAGVVPRVRPRLTELYSGFVCGPALRILGIRIVVRQPERLRSDPPRILLPNHQSLLDGVVIGSLIPPRTITVGKQSLRWIPFFGCVFVWSGSLFIDRGNHERALRTMKTAQESILRRGLSVIISPEGTRDGGRGLLPFKKGPFHLALGTGLPLQPMVLSSFHRCLNLWRWNAGTVVVEMLEPIPTAGRDLTALDPLIAETHARMKAAWAVLDAELDARRK